MLTDTPSARVAIEHDNVHYIGGMMTIDDRHTIIGEFTHVTLLEPTQVSFWDKAKDRVAKADVVLLEGGTNEMSGGNSLHNEVLKEADRGKVRALDISPSDVENRRANYSRQTGVEATTEVVLFIDLVNRLPFDINNGLDSKKLLADCKSRYPTLTDEHIVYVISKAFDMVMNDLEHRSGDIAAATQLDLFARERHMQDVVADVLESGSKVLVTCGAEHASGIAETMLNPAYRTEIPAASMEMYLRILQESRMPAS